MTLHYDQPEAAVYDVYLDGERLPRVLWADEHWNCVVVPAGAQEWFAPPRLLCGAVEIRRILPVTGSGFDAGLPPVVPESRGRDR